jgi:hypothetical protein
VVGLPDEAQRLLPGAHVAVELEGGRPHQEQALRRRLHQGGEVGQRIGVAEGAVGAVGGEHRGHRVDVALGHAERVAGEQLLELGHVVDR